MLSLTNLFLSAFKGGPNAFRNAQSEGKAVKRLKRALPSSPRKSRQAVRKLALEVGIILPDNNVDETRGRKKVDQSTIDQVNSYYIRDDVSRVAPGMKDCKKINGEMIQKRHLYANIN